MAFPPVVCPAVLPQVVSELEGVGAILVTGEIYFVLQNINCKIVEDIVSFP